MATYITIQNHTFTTVEGITLSSLHIGIDARFSHRNSIKGINPLVCGASAYISKQGIIDGATPIRLKDLDLVFQYIPSGASIDFADVYAALKAQLLENNPEWADEDVTIVIE